jgi:hypothetical protein
MKLKLANFDYKNKTSSSISCSHNLRFKTHDVINGIYKDCFIKFEESALLNIECGLHLLSQTISKLNK